VVRSSTPWNRSGKVSSRALRRRRGPGGDRRAGGVPEDAHRSDRV